MITTEKRFEIGKRYKFPQLSTRDVTVLETIENWIEFHENEVLWNCEYRAICKDEEDPDTKIVSDVEKVFCWRHVCSKEDLEPVEYIFYPDSNMWRVNIQLRGSESTMRLAFSTRDKAIKMYNYFCQYKGFEHY